MALIVKDRVQETTTTEGTGTLTLLGAETGFQTFSSAIGNTNTTYYAISSNGSEWEVGIGTVGAGTLARTTILASSNGGSVVTLSAGTKFVFCTQPAGKSLYLDASGNTISLGILTSPKIGTSILDTNGNELALLTATASAVNELTIANAATGTSPTISATGSDTNIGINLTPKGTGGIVLGAGNVLIGTTTTGSKGISLVSDFNIGYAQGTGESVPNIFRQTSSAATVIGNGIRHSTTANGFASSYSPSFAKTAIALNEGTIRFFSDGATTVAAGTDLTPTERMRIDSSGNVGIGITSPDQKLHVFKGSAGTVTSATDTVLTIENNANAILQFLSPAGNEAVLLFGDPDNNSIGSIGYSHPTNVMSFSTNGTASMTIASTGRVSVARGGLSVVDANNRDQGTAQFTVTGSGYTLHNFLDGTAAYIGQNSNSRSLRIYSGGSSGTGVNLAAGGTSWGTYSDERLKRNINDLGICINKINSMRPITFNYISDEEDFKTRIGISAQSLVGQVDEALDLCKYSDEEPTEYYNVRYQDLIPVLVKGIQEQQAIIEQLKATSISQQTKIDDLEDRLTALENN